MKIWTASHKGHEIRVENGWFSGEKLLVDGEIQDQRRGPACRSMLIGRISSGGEVGEPIKASIGGWFVATCDLFVNDKLISSRTEHIHSPKTIIKIFAVTLLSVLGLVGLRFMFCSLEKSTKTLHVEKAISDSTFETINSEVLKVFSAQETTAVFRAYLVNWKGHEVVVSDTLAGSKYQVGETIPVLCMNLAYPSQKKPIRLLSFQVGRASDDPNK